MPKTFFISDLHLSPEDPETLNLFLKFIDYCIQQNIDHLYILGDFFNYWLGNDSLETWHQPIIEALKKLGKTTKIFFIVGNRDFLVDKTTGSIFGFTLIEEDYQIIQLNSNSNILLLHGDTLCTNDKRYQKFRSFVQHPVIKKIYLTLPLKLRMRLAKDIKKRSLNRSDYVIQPEKYDVVLESVQELFKNTRTNIMIHGHTHQPKVHEYKQNDTKQFRYVLGDWHGDSAYFLEANYDSDRLLSLELKLFNLQS